MDVMSEVRAVAKSFKKKPYTNQDIGDKLPHIASSSISRAMVKLVSSNEIEVVSKLNCDRGGTRNVYRTIKILTTKQLNDYPVLSLPLGGWRMVYPELFADPKLKGTRRIINNGLGI